MMMTAATANERHLRRRTLEIWRRSIVIRSPDGAEGMATECGWSPAARGNGRGQGLPPSPTSVKVFKRVSPPRPLDDVELATLGPHGRERLPNLFV